MQILRNANTCDIVDNDLLKCFKQKEFNKLRVIENSYRYEFDDIISAPYDVMLWFIRADIIKILK